LKFGSRLAVTLCLFLNFLKLLVKVLFKIFEPAVVLLHNSSHFLNFTNAFFKLNAQRF